MLPKEERLEEAFWTDEVAGKMEVDVQEILKKAGIIS